jgi:hypothetical protein
MADIEKPSGGLEDAARRPRAGIAAELLALLRHNKKWWLLPILVILFLLGLLAVLGGSPLAPFIYTLF